MPELRGDSKFSYQISISKVYTTKQFFSRPILCKLGTNQPFVKWISVSLNKASHSNRNYSKVQNKRGRGLKLVLDRHYAIAFRLYWDSPLSNIFFFYDFLKERKVKYTKLIWAFEQSLYGFTLWWV